MAAVDTSNVASLSELVFPAAGRLACSGCVKRYTLLGNVESSTARMLDLQKGQQGEVKHSREES
uniref:Uncharacterized protein n=1 Tax=Solanum lycopersicum TaxID=4081 RepID=A0A3Q7G8K3_SOLLC